MKPMRAFQNHQKPGGVLAALCLLPFACGLRVVQAQQTPAVKPAAAVTRPVAEAEEQPSKPSKPGHEGIKIHGHWVLQVKNADGTLGERREFENSLVAGSGLNTTSGDQLLAGLLSGNLAISGIAVAFINGPVTTAGLDTSSYCGSNVIGQPAIPAGINCYAFIPSGNPWVDFSPNIEQQGLGETVTFSPTVGIVLTGNYSVPSGLVEIDAVQTYGHYCYNASTLTGSFRLTGASVPFNQSVFSSAGCVIGASGSTSVAAALTSTNVPTPLTGLTSGQVITVTVTLSFS